MAVGARIIVYHGAVGSAAAPIADGEVFLDLTAGWYVGAAGVWVAAPGGGSYTDEMAQDAVGAMRADSARVTLTYVDATPSLTADLVADSITAGYLHATATDVLFGRSTAGAGAGQEIACTATGRSILDDTSVGAVRTTLGGTTVGSNFFTLTNPSAITFPRINADNSVSALDAATFRTAIGAGTGSGSGTVTSVSVVTANGVSGSVATATTTPAITLTLGDITPTSVAASGGNASSFTFEDGATATVSTALTFAHNTTGTAADGFGTLHLIKLETSTTADTSAADVGVKWVTAAHATRKAQAFFRVYDTAAREYLRAEASGTAPMIGFLGSAASIQLVSPDVGTALVTFGLAGGTPTFAAANLTGTTLPAAIVTSSLTAVGTVATGTWSATTIAVNKGGTGLTTLTAHALYVGNGTSAPTALAVGTNGQALVGQTGADPSWNTVSGSGATITMSSAGVLTISGILNASLAGSITAAKLVGTDITTVGTLTAGATGAGFTVALDTSTFTGTLSVTNGGTNANLSATGGTAQVLKQASAGADVTVAVLGTTEIPTRHNLLCNGGAWFWVRQPTPGTLATYADDAYFADRWYVLTQTGTIQCNRTTGNTGPYALDLKQTQASAQRMGCAQILENLDTVPMRGRTVRLQFNAKCSTTTTLRYAIVEWTGTADTVTSDIVNTWTSTTYTASNFFIASTTATTGTTSVGTSYTACSLSASVSASANNLIVFVWTDGTAAQNVTVELAELVLCDANLARDWLPDHVSIEQTRCKRFARGYNGQVVGIAQTAQVMFSYGHLTFDPPMRATPALYAGATYTAGVGANGTVGLDGSTSDGGGGLYNVANNWTLNAVIKVTMVLDAEL